MGITVILWKYMMKNKINGLKKSLKSAYLPKINISLQFVDEILALSYSSDFIQILVILSWF